MAKKKKSETPEEKPTPKRCACGELGIVVKKRGGAMVSCPNPARCSGNYRTTWRKSEAEAVAEWNTMELK